MPVARCTTWENAWTKPSSLASGLLRRYLRREHEMGTPGRGSGLTSTSTAAYTDQRTDVAGRTLQRRDPQGGLLGSPVTCLAQSCARPLRDHASCNAHVNVSGTYARVWDVGISLSFHRHTVSGGKAQCWLVRLT